MNDVALYDHIGCPAGQNTILVPFTAQKPTRFPSYPSLHPLSLSSLNSHCPHYHALSLSPPYPTGLPLTPLSLSHILDPLSLPKTLFSPCRACDNSPLDHSASPSITILFARNHSSVPLTPMSHQSQPRLS
jgi:hypothetical protein